MIYVDNTSSIANSLNNKNHQHTKHIDVKHYFVNNNIADLLIKLLL